MVGYVEGGVRVAAEFPVDEFHSVCKKECVFKTSVVKSALGPTCLHGRGFHLACVCVCVCVHLLVDIFVLLGNLIFVSRGTLGSHFTGCRSKFTGNVKQSQVGNSK